MSETQGASPPLPPVVYVPVRPGGTKDQQEIELRTLQDGRLALLVYTALDRLTLCCGPHQSWALFPLDELSVVQTLHRFEVVLTDQPLPEELWHTAEEA